MSDQNELSPESDINLHIVCNPSCKLLALNFFSNGNYFDKNNILFCYKNVVRFLWFTSGNVDSIN